MWTVAFSGIHVSEILVLTPAAMYLECCVATIHPSSVVSWAGVIRNGRCYVASFAP